jgi:Cu/Ag efflux protein CusF
MKNVWRFGFSTLAGSVLVVGALALPPANTHQTQERQQAAAQTQSVSGKIASVEKNSFTLTLSTASTSVSQDPQQPPSSAKTMSFTIDQNTTVEGKLKVGANADVTYRQDNGANVAISVHVAP